MGGIGWTVGAMARARAGWWGERCTATSLWLCTEGRTTRLVPPERPEPFYPNKVRISREIRRGAV
jgi:hypothetical protein